MQPLVRQTLRQLVWGLLAILAFSAATLSSAGVGYAYAYAYEAGHADGFSAGASNTEALLQLMGQQPVDWNDPQVQAILSRMKQP